MEQVRRIGHIAHRWRNPRRPQRLPSLIAPFFCAEDLLFEVVELTFVLERDGFGEAQVLDRLSYLLLPFQLERRRGDLVQDLVRQHLAIADPFYLDIHDELMEALLWPTQVWARSFATELLEGSWPEAHVEMQASHTEGYWVCGIEEAGISRRSRLTGKVHDLDVLLLAHRYKPIARGLRRLKARCLPSDCIRGFCRSRSRGYRFDTAELGIGLIRNGKMIDRIVTCWAQP